MGYRLNPFTGNFDVVGDKASYLSTTSGLVDIVSAPPISGQVLVATSSGTASWQTLSVSATIPDNSVTFQKIQTINANTLLGRSTTGTGNVEQITISTGLNLSSGILTVASGYVATSGANGLMSAADKAKLDLINGTTILKSGLVSGASFAGNPKKTTITFASNYADTNYTINIAGQVSRSWSYESKTVSGFVINANANAAFTQEVSWQTNTTGETRA